MSSISQPAIIVVADETDQEAINFTLKWSIQHFDRMKNVDSSMYSPGITMAELGMAESFRGRWRIRVTPCYARLADNGTVDNYVSVYLCLTNEDTESTVYTGNLAVSCFFKQCVTTGKALDVPVSSRTSNLHTFSSDSDQWGYSKSMSHGDLFGWSGQAGCLKDSCLNIAMDVTIYLQPKTIRTSETVAPGLLARYQEFLGRLQQQKGAGDFLLISSDKKEFHVDHYLLVAHSPVFAAMLNHDSKEKQTSRCEMKDVDGECVEILLEYVCGCDTSKIQGSNAEKVLGMADKYQMTDLRVVCELELANSITVDNAVRVFVLARHRNLGTLEEVALKFIRKNMDMAVVLDEFLDV